MPIPNDNLHVNFYFLYLSSLSRSVFRFHIQNIVLRQRKGLVQKPKVLVKRPAKVQRFSSTSEEDSSSGFEDNDINSQMSAMVSFLQMVTL